VSNESPPLDTRTLAGIASAVASTVPRWREQLAVADDPSERSALRIWATEDYDVWLLGWPPGSSVEPHDHGVSAGAFSVVSGEVEEIRWNGTVRLNRRVGPGASVTIEPGVIHDVVGGAVPALSVHVYSPPLTTMNFYERTLTSRR
jgi:predicted metal-dependent enzyme (double-stranded beta helix superfamily)